MSRAYVISGVVFTSREIAVASWTLIVVTVLALRDRSIVRSMAAVVRAAAAPKILAAVVCMLFYVIGVVSLLARVHLWDTPLLKDTVLWFVFVGLALMGRYATSRGEIQLTDVLRDNIKIVVFLELVLSTYTLPLMVEFVVVPFVTLLVMMSVVAKSDPRYVIVGRMINGLLVVIGIAMLITSMRYALSDPVALSAFRTWRDMLMAPLLSLTLLPFLYVMMLYVAYEQIFTRLRLGPTKEAALQRYAKRRLVRHLRFRLGTVQNFLLANAPGLMSIRTTRDVDNLINRSVSIDQNA